MLDAHGFETFEENDFPQGYLITIRTYGTWLHGDKRHSVARNGTNVYGMPDNPPNEGLEQWMIQEMGQQPRLLNEDERETVRKSVEELCFRKSYQLHALNVRSNHAHAVLTAQRKPERIIVELKTNATKFLREAGQVGPEERVWSRGKSRRYLWKPRNVIAAVNYVLFGQGDEFFVSEEWERYAVPSG